MIPAFAKMVRLPSDTRFFLQEQNLHFSQKLNIIKPEEAAINIGSGS
jgi:hypothetical protein